MKITTVVENNAPENSGLSGEWGLSLHISFEGKQYLLDTGKTDLYAENAPKLGVSIADVDTAVLSHAHYDHSGGYDSFFTINRKAKLYLRSCCKENCYGQHGWKRAYIGIPRGIMKKYEDRIVRVDGDYQLDENVWLIPHKQENLGPIGKKAKLYIRKGLRFYPDDFLHEQSLVFKTEKGLVILNSCSHSGAYNIIREVQKTFEGQPVLAMIGGFHLKSSSPEEVREFGENLKKCEVKYLYTGHCTGIPAYQILKGILGDRLQPLTTGTVIEF